MIGILNSVLALGVYLRIVVPMYRPAPDVEGISEKSLHQALAVVIGVAAIVTLGMGLLAGFLPGRCSKLWVALKIHCNEGAATASILHTPRYRRPKWPKKPRDPITPRRTSTQPQDAAAATKGAATPKPVPNHRQSPKSR